MAELLLPLFEGTGEDPELWLESLEDYFEEFNIAMDCWVDLAIRGLKGTAASWAVENKSLISKDWCAFNYHLLWKFNPTTKPPDSDANETVEITSVVAVKEVSIEEAMELDDIPEATIEIVGYKKPHSVDGTDETEIVQGYILNLTMLPFHFTFDCYFGICVFDPGVGKCQCEFSRGGNTVHIMLRVCGNNEMFITQECIDNSASIRDKEDEALITAQLSLLQRIVIPSLSPQAGIVVALSKALSYRDTTQYERWILLHQKTWGQMIWLSELITFYGDTNQFPSYSYLDSCYLSSSGTSLPDKTKDITASSSSRLSGCQTLSRFASPISPHPGVEYTSWFSTEPCSCLYVQTRSQRSPSYMSELISGRTYIIQGLFLGISNFFLLQQQTFSFGQDSRDLARKSALYFKLGNCSINASVILYVVVQVAPLITCDTHMVILAQIFFQATSIYTIRFKDLIYQLLRVAGYTHLCVLHLLVSQTSTHSECIFIFKSGAPIKLVCYTKECLFSMICVKLQFFFSCVAPLAFKLWQESSSVVESTTIFSGSGSSTFFPHLKDIQAASIIGIENFRGQAVRISKRACFGGRITLYSVGVIHRVSICRRLHEANELGLCLHYFNRVSITNKFLYTSENAVLTVRGVVQVMFGSSLEFDKVYAYTSVFKFPLHSDFRKGHHQPVLPLIQACLCCLRWQIFIFLIHYMVSNSVGVCNSEVPAMSGCTYDHQLHKHGISDDTSEEYTTTSNQFQCISNFSCRSSDAGRIWGVELFLTTRCLTATRYMKALMAGVAKASRTCFAILLTSIISYHDIRAVLSKGIMLSFKVIAATQLQSSVRCKVFLQCALTEDRGESILHFTRLPVCHRVTLLWCVSWFVWSSLLSHRGGLIYHLPSLIGSSPTVTAAGKCAGPDLQNRGIFSQVIDLSRGYRFYALVSLPLSSCATIFLAITCQFFAQEITHLRTPKIKQSRHYHLTNWLCYYKLTWAIHYVAYVPMAWRTCQLFRKELWRMLFIIVRHFSPIGYRLLFVTDIGRSGSTLSTAEKGLLQADARVIIWTPAGVLVCDLAILHYVEIKFLLVKCDIRLRIEQLILSFLVKTWGLYNLYSKEPTHNCLPVGQFVGLYTLVLTQSGGLHPHLDYSMPFRSPCFKLVYMLSVNHYVRHNINVGLVEIRFKVYWVWGPHSSVGMHVFDGALIVHYGIQIILSLVHEVFTTAERIVATQGVFLVGSCPWGQGHFQGGGNVMFPKYRQA